MDIETSKAEATTRTGLPRTHPINSTWQHGIKSLVHREQVDGSREH